MSRTATLDPLAAAQREALLAQLRHSGFLVLDGRGYRCLRLIYGLPRGRVDRLVADLAAEGLVRLDPGGGVVCAYPVEETAGGAGP